MTVLLFAAAREAAGTGSVTLDLPATASVADAFAQLAADRPALAGILGACRAAMDEDFVPRATQLRDGATLAVLPPVSGG